MKGIAQYEQRLSQPSEIFRYAYGSVESLRTLPLPEGLTFSTPSALSTGSRYLRNHVPYLFHITLGETTEYYDLSDESRVLSRYYGEYGFDRFLLCISDEAAGVQQHTVNPARIILGHYLIPLRAARKHVLRVDGILRAAQGDGLEYLPVFHHIAIHYASASAASSPAACSSSAKSREAYFFSSLYHSTTFFICET